MPHLSTWSTSPLLPVGVLVGGAILVWLAGRFLPPGWSAAPRVRSALPIVALLAAVISIWSLRRPVSPTRFLLIFPPTLGMNLSLGVQWDEWGRLFGLSLLWPALIVAGLDVRNAFSNGKDAADAIAWPQWLLSLAAAHVVLAAADWLTLTAALVLFDLVCLAIAAPQHERGWSFLANGLAGELALLVAAFTLSIGDHSLALVGGAPLPPTAALLVSVAALVRLGPYPFHCWLPDAQEMPLPAWRWPMRLLSAIMGLYLMERITPLLAGSVPVMRLVSTVGSLGCLAVALLAWLGAQRDPKRAISSIALYHANLAMLAWAVLGEQHTAFWIAIGLILGTVALTMHRAWIDNRDGEPLPWRDAIPGGVATAALVGLPLTVGLFVRLPLCKALLANRQVVWLVLLLLAEGVLVAALLRVWSGLNPDVFAWQRRGERPRWNPWGAMALLVVPLLVLGVFPSLVAWLAGARSSEGFVTLPTWRQLTRAGIGPWAAFLLPLVMGYGVYRSQWTWPDEMADVEDQLVLALRLGWLHRAAARFLGQIRQALWSLGALLHGEGYLAWVAFSFLLIFLLVLSR